MMTDPGDHAELHCHHRRGDADGQAKVRDQEGQRVPDAAEGGHDAAHAAPQPGMPAAAQRAVVRQRLGEAHADAGAHRGRQPH